MKTPKKKPSNPTMPIAMVAIPVLASAYVYEDGEIFAYPLSDEGEPDFDSAYPVVPECFEGCQRNFFTFLKDYLTYLNLAVTHLVRETLTEMNAGTSANESDSNFSEIEIPAEEEPLFLLSELPDPGNVEGRIYKFSAN